MSNKISIACTLLKERNYREIIYTVREKIPHKLFQYNNFYIMYCKSVTKTNLLRYLGNDYKLITEKFRYEHLVRVKRDLHNDLGTVYFRLQGKEDNTYSIYIKHKDKIVSINFLLFDNIIASPSGYCLDMQIPVGQIHGAFIDPRYRLRGLHLVMLESAFHLSSNNGNRGLYSEIHYRNKHSFFSYNRLGFEVYKNIKYISILNRKFFFEGKRNFLCGASLH